VDFNEAIRLDPLNIDAFRYLAAIYFARKEYDKAIMKLDEVMVLAPTDAQAHVRLAWLLATCPKEKLRNGKKAVELATKVAEATEQRVGVVLEALAAANAECGEFKEAVKCQKKAIELGFADETQNEKARQRLKLYEAGNPYRDE
jgi:tetratricopeptide (TPR) repeat protein